jgi:hypothetical protein
MSNAISPAKRVTNNGEHNVILNGIPDWVYEGEWQGVCCRVQILFELMQQETHAMPVATSTEPHPNKMRFLWPIF